MQIGSENLVSTLIANQVYYENNFFDVIRHYRGFPKIYKYLSTNIEVNNLRGVVIPIMAGYGTGEPVKIEHEENRRASVLLNDEGTGIIIIT